MHTNTTGRESDRPVPAPVVPVDEDLPQVTAYTRYEWDCAECGEPNTTEHDPAGEEVECVCCDARARVGETK